MANENFNQFGPTFQAKIISSLLSDNKFIQTISDILEPNFFDSDANKWLTQEISKYFNEFRKAPTLEVLKIKITQMDDEILKVSVVENLKDAWRNIEATDLEFVKQETLDFCKNQVLKGAIVQAVDLLEQKKYDEIKVIVDNAMKAGSERDLGHDYIISLEDRLTESVRATVPTPWDSVTNVMDGGLAGGELGVLVAPAGIGKTWCLQALAAHLVKVGKTVVHYTLELNEAYVGLRYDTVFSGTPTANIKFYQDDVQKVIDGLDGKLIIKYYPTRSASVNTLAAHLKQMEIQEIKPDAVIVDYADILKPTTFYKEKRHATGETYENLRGMAGEFDIPIWTASQANRSSLEEDVIDATKVSEDYSKVMTADFVMSVSRKVEDKIANTGRFHVIKNRFGIDGITFPANINTNTGLIQVHEASTVAGKQAQGKMDNSEEYLRKTLSQKYKDMEGFE
jgi:replicative DNA helicase